MKDVKNILDRFISKNNIRRVFYEEHKLPNDIDNICIIPIFSDIRHLCVLSTYLIRKFIQNDKPSKYVIILGHSGFSCLFSCADEYWELEDDEANEQLASKGDSFSNTSDVYNNLLRELNHWFYEIIDPNYFEQYYENSFNLNYIEKYSNFNRWVPSIKSVSVLSDYERNQIMGYKSRFICLMPTKFIYYWSQGKEHKLKVPIHFWKELIKYLNGSKYKIISIQPKGWCYDLSSEFGEDIAYCNSSDMSKVFALMRWSKCVLDFFQDIYCLSMISRTPFVKFEERNRYNCNKLYEIEDVYGFNLNNKYIFGFSTLINSQGLDLNFFSIIEKKIETLFEEMNEELLPSSSESLEVIPYQNVKKRTPLRLGAKFIKIENI